MADIHPNTDEKEVIRGWHVLVAMVLFFGIIVSVNFYMAYQAKSSWTGLVVKNGYVASQEFNEKLAAAKAQKALGWHSTIGYREGKVMLILKDKDGKPVLLENANVVVGHPVEAHDDITLMLHHEGGGVYTAPAELIAGEWLFTLNASHNGQPYIIEDRIMVKNNH